MNYEITKKTTYENGVSLIEVLNKKSGMTHKGVIRKNGVIEIMVGTMATLKRIQIS